MDNIDKSNFRQFILDVPKSFEVGLNLAKNIKVDGNFESVTVSGMGGSALPANLLRTYLNDLFKIHINRSYLLPSEAYNNSLNFIASYSGNTEETISSLEKARSAGLKFVGLSSGGRVEELCRKYGAPHIKLPLPYPNFQPRMGTGYFFGAMLALLINQGLVPDTTSELKAQATKLESSMNDFEERGKSLAKKLVGKTPVIYSSPKFKPVAMVWKIKINENAKTPAFWNFLPEMDHNELVGFTNPQGKFFAVMLRDNEDDSRNFRRYGATAKLLSEKGIDSEIIDMEGSDAFYKMFASIAISDWTSYHLALLYNQDPTPVNMVEDLKKILIS
ncbi:MAG: bifunctional phosphoglucose/phosphomannose isomerase [Candidatus Levybacteria bacterium]|nr:bifunctional phosphoglucose/phosphomannose isomerase [Candidatus Levybacteria bacterium]